MKKYSASLIGWVAIVAIALSSGSCSKRFEEYPVNPNVASENGVVPADFILRRVLFEVYRGGGVLDGRNGNVPEEAWQLLSRYNQFQAGLLAPLYGGFNEYDWSNTADNYSILRNLQQMERYATTSYGTERNPYLAVSKVLKAYMFTWYSLRVGDIPMKEAGLGLENETPVFDKQEEVFEACLKLLEEANDDFTAILSDATSTTLIGDFYFNNDITKWQKLSNTFKLRLLIHLSKRADDTPAMRIKERFSETLADAVKYPIMENTEDNLQFDYVAMFNRPNIVFRAQYPDQTCIGAAYLDLTTTSNDPRTFMVATPAPALLLPNETEPTNFDDFSVYKGADNSILRGTLLAEAQEGNLSYPNYLRYLRGTLDNYPEPYMIIGYPEMCFNIAEAINRGWATGDAKTWYDRGIDASMAFFGIAEGTEIPVGNVNGGITYGNVTVDMNAFLTHPNVVYKGGADGLIQILNQKYLAMWQNSGWEPYYSFRRTGYPELREGPGNGAAGKIPVRFRYPPAELQNNTNAQPAISSQFGTDNVSGIMWLIK